MTDHDHGEWYSRERKKHVAHTAKVDAEIDAMIAEYRPSFWSRHARLSGIIVGIVFFWSGYFFAEWFLSF